VQGRQLNRPQGLVRRMRLLIAFLTAPVLPAFVPTWFSYVNRTYDPLTAFVFFYGLFFLLEAIIGIPGYKLFDRTSKHPLWAYAALGFCATAVPSLLLSLYRQPQEGYALATLLYLTCYAGVLGAGTGLMFWILARPDKILREERPQSKLIH
jgi:hypothetical protein